MMIEMMTEIMIKEDCKKNKILHLYIATLNYKLIYLALACNDA